MRVWIRLLLLAAALGSQNCTRHTDPTVLEVAPLKPEEWIARAQQANSLADSHLEQGKLQEALSVLHQLIEDPVPSSVQERDHRAIGQDTYFRLALCEIEMGNPKQALTWTDEGLGLGKHDDLFSANLYLAKGRALEAIGKDRLATEQYHLALIINEALLDQVLESQNNPENHNP